MKCVGCGKSNVAPGMSVCIPCLHIMESEMTTEEMCGRKLCTNCLVYKPVEDFHANRRTPDGLCPKCKTCRALPPETTIGPKYQRRADKQIELRNLAKNMKEPL